MRVLVTGINGQLGYDVVKELNQRGHQAIGSDRDAMDLTSLEEINKVIMSIKPDGIIHCAAYTSVDAAEENEDLCRQINALSVKEIAKCSKLLDIPMIYISTDYVFDGRKDGEYTEEDTPNPINVYGKTKYEGELYVQEILEKYYIVRISWVFGENGNNFIKTMLRLGNEKDSLNIISDQVGSPTNTRELSSILVDMIETNKYGIYNVTNEGFCSWYEFAKEIFNISGMNINVNPIPTSQYPTKAQRPMNSKMSKEKLTQNGFDRLKPWDVSIKNYINIIK